VRHYLRDLRLAFWYNTGV